LGVVWNKAGDKDQSKKRSNLFRGEDTFSTSKTKLKKKQSEKMNKQIW
jgi:hypothetical protein